jgi:hypothetical protein
MSLIEMSAETNIEMQVCCFVFTLFVIMGGRKPPSHPNQKPHFPKNLQSGVCVYFLFLLTYVTTASSRVGSQLLPASDGQRIKYLCLTSPRCSWDNPTTSNTFKYYNNNKLQHFKSEALVQNSSDARGIKTLDQRACCHGDGALHCFVVTFAVRHTHTHIHLYESNLDLTRLAVDIWSVNI